MQNRTYLIRILFVLFFMMGLGCLDKAELVQADKSEALTAALKYLSTSHYSRNGLIDRLVADGFSREDAEYAASNIYVDWYQMAADTAAAYLETSDYSYNGLIRRLESSSDGFTHEEAVWGVDTAAKDVDWSEMAARRAAFYLKSSAFSEAGLIRQLESEMIGFTHEEAVKGVGIASANVDWTAMAVKRAEALQQTGAFSEQGLISQLESPSVGFTHEQAVSAVAVLSETTDWNQVAVRKAESYLQVMSVTRQELIDYLESPAEGFTHEQALFAVDNCGASWSDMIGILSNNLDNLFPIRGLEEKFTTPAQALYSDIGQDTAVQTKTQDGQRTISLFANSDGIHDHTLVTRINSGQLQNFLFSMDITINDAFPAGAAGCSVGYINDLAAAKQLEEEKIVTLMADGSGVGFYVKNKSEAAGTFTRVSDLVSDKYTITIVRFTGQTYAYVDGEYAGQLQDTNAGPFQLFYGVSVLAGGDDASCSFDNLSVKKVNN